MLNIVKKFVPFRIRSEIRRLLADWKCPSMIYGYANHSGAFSKNTRISQSAILYRPDRISIGDHVFIGHYSFLDGSGGLEICEGTQVSAHVAVVTHGSHISIRLLGRHYMEVPEEEKPGYKMRKVTIGKFVYIGVGARILPGVSIGDGSLVGAGSVVTKDIPSFAIVQGVPARNVGDTREMDRQYLQDEQLRKWYEEWQTITDPEKITCTE